MATKVDVNIRYVLDVLDKGVKTAIAQTSDFRKASDGATATLMKNSSLQKEQYRLLSRAASDADAAIVKSTVESSMSVNKALDKQITGLAKTGLAYKEIARQMRVDGAQMNEIASSIRRVSTEQAAAITRLQESSSHRMGLLNRSVGATSHRTGVLRGAGGMIAGTAGLAAGYFGVQGIRSAFTGTEERLLQARQLQIAGMSSTQAQSLALESSLYGVAPQSVGQTVRALSTQTTHALGTPFTKPSGASAAAFAQLGITPAQLKADSGNVGNLLGLVADKIKGGTHGAQEYAAAALILGRGFAKLQPLLKDGSKGLTDFQTAAKNAGAIVQGSTVKALEEAHKRAILLKLGMAGLQTAVAENLAPVLVKVLPVIAKVFGTIARFMESKGFKDAVDGIIKAIAPVVPFFKNVVGPILEGVFKGALAIISPIAQALGALGKAAAPLGGVFRAVGTAMVILFGGAIGKGVGFVETLVTKIPYLGRVFALLLTPIRLAVTGIGKAFDAISTSLSGVIGVSSALIKTALAAVTGLITGFWSTIQSGVSAGWKAITGAFSSAWSTITGGVTSAWKAIESVFASALDVIKVPVNLWFGWLKTEFNFFTVTLPNIVSGGFNAVLGFVKGLPGDFAAAAKAIFDAFINVFNGLGGVVSGIFRGAVNIVVDIVNSVIGMIDGIALPSVHLPLGLGTIGGGHPFHLGKLAHLNAGGWVPGDSHRDGTLAMLAGNEFVLTGHGQSMLDAHAPGLLGHIAASQLPHFATGGSVDSQWSSYIGAHKKASHARTKHPRTAHPHVTQPRDYIVPGSVPPRLEHVLPSVYREQELMFRLHKTAKKPAVSLPELAAAVASLGPRSSLLAGFQTTGQGIAGSSLVKSAIADVAVKLVVQHAKTIAAAATRPNATSFTLSGSKAISTATVGGRQAYAASLLGSYGWPQSEMAPLTKLWNLESGWQMVQNAGAKARGISIYNSAFGIPQADPGSKMAASGSDWMTNPATQIRWGLGYIKGAYSTPSRAWAQEVSSGFKGYRRGGSVGGRVHPTHLHHASRPVGIDKILSSLGGMQQAEDLILGLARIPNASTTGVVASTVTRLASSLDGWQNKTARNLERQQAGLQRELAKVESSGKIPAVGKVNAITDAIAAVQAKVAQARGAAINGLEKLAGDLGSKITTLQHAKKPNAIEIRRLQTARNLVEAEVGNRIEQMAASATNASSTYLANSQSQFSDSLTSKGIDSASTTGLQLTSAYEGAVKSRLATTVEQLGRAVKMAQRTGNQTIIQDVESQYSAALNSLNDATAAQIQAARQAVAQAAQDAVDSATHAETLATTGEQGLSLRQQLANPTGTPSVADAGHIADYIKQQVIPAIQADIAALAAQQQTAQAQGNTTLANQIGEAIASKQNDILSEQLTAQQGILSASQASQQLLRNFGGATGFAFHSQDQTDLVGVATGLGL